MVVGFLVLNMVVGIVVNNYQLCQEKQERADRKIKSRKTDESLEIVDKTRNGELSCELTDTVVHAFILKLLRICSICKTHQVFSGKSSFVTIIFGQ